MNQSASQQRKAQCCSNQVSSIHTRSLNVIGVEDCEIRLRRELRSEFSLTQWRWGKRDFCEDERYSSSAGLFVLSMHSPGTASQAREPDAPHGLRPLPHSCGNQDARYDYD